MEMARCIRAPSSRLDRPTGYALWTCAPWRDAVVGVCGAARPRRGRAKLAEATRPWRAAQAGFETVFGRSDATACREVLLGIAYDQRLSGLRE
jgi:hypothetical protein